MFNKKSNKNKHKNYLYKIDKMLDIPEEVISDETKITIMGFNSVLIENYKIVLEYQDIFIRIKIHNGFINMNGLNLKIDEMNNDDILIVGEIEEIEFEKIE